MYSTKERSRSSAINFQACTQPWEPLFARKLGETEDIKKACQAAGVTAEEGKRAMRNPSVCTLAAEEHAKVCERLLVGLRDQLPLAEAVATRSELMYKQSKHHKDFGVAYDDEKRVKHIAGLINHLELRKHRSAWTFYDSKFERNEL